MKNDSVELNKLSFTKEGFSLLYLADKARLQTLPTWNPESEDPPLSLRDAYATGVAWLTSVGVTVKTPYSFIIGSFDKIHWHYILTFNSTSESLMPDLATALVLMDNSVVEPVRQYLKSLQENTAEQDAAANP